MPLLKRTGAVITTCNCQRCGGTGAIHCEVVKMTDAQRKAMSDAIALGRSIWGTQRNREDECFANGLIAGICVGVVATLKVTLIAWAIYG